MAKKRTESSKPKSLTRRRKGHAPDQPHSKRRKVKKAENPKAGTMHKALHALKTLREGNRRFVAGLRSVDNFRSQLRLPELARIGQSPFAIILSCSDSRAPAEILFDQGLGDLFVIRVAGNIIAPSLVGSVEFAAATYGVQLVVVMGHTGCGAVLATLEAMKGNGAAPTASENIQDIISRIRPSIEPLSHLKLDPETLYREATKANIMASVNHLRHGSRLIEELVGSGKMLVVGAECDIKTGLVDFFDGVPDGFTNGPEEPENFNSRTFQIDSAHSGDSRRARPANRGARELFDVLNIAKVIEKIPRKISTSTEFPSGL